MNTEDKNAIVHAIERVGDGITVTGTDNIAQVNGATVNVGTGAAGTGTLRVTTSTDSTIGTVTTVTAVTAVTSITNAVSTKETPDATTTFCPDSDLSAALEASSVSKASAGVFYGLSGYNSLASAQWILVYNTTAVPANGAVVPIAVIRAAASSNFSFDSGKFGIFCSTGICWSNSTDATIFNKTLGAADIFCNLLFK